MPLKIYKYQLELIDEQRLHLPDGCEFLTVQEQGGKLCLWAAVDTDKCERDFWIIICGTGDTMPDAKLSYINTVQLGPMVWHVFYK